MTPILGCRTSNRPICCWTAPGASSWRISGWRGCWDPPRGAPTATRWPPGTGFWGVPPPGCRGAPPEAEDPPDPPFPGGTEPPSCSTAPGTTTRAWICGESPLLGGSPRDFGGPPWDFGVLPRVLGSPLTPCPALLDLGVPPLGLWILPRLLGPPHSVIPGLPLVPGCPLWDFGGSPLGFGGVLLDFWWVPAGFWGVPLDFWGGPPGFWGPSCWMPGVPHFRVPFLGL